MEYNLHLLSNTAERLWHTPAGNALLSLREDTLVSYWDPFGTTSLKNIALPNVSVHIQVLAGQILNPLSNKRIFPTLLRQQNCSHLSPRSFETVEDDETFSRGKNRIWFLENIYGTAGLAMECVKMPDLAKIDLKKHYVIEEGEVDLELDDGKNLSRMFTFYAGRENSIFSLGLFV